MQNKQVLGALAMDLKRVALGYFRGSIPMAEKFYEEACKRKNEVNTKAVKPYIAKLLNDMENISKEEHAKAADDALLYSTLFQNASQT
jgi:hypothetical protein